jgi:excisionase family DNA binding protein
MTQDKCTIQDAARTLNIDRRKIYRMIDKGLISSIKEDGKTFVLMEELKAICAQPAQENAQESTERTRVHTEEHTHFFVDKQHYEGLLIKLGQMEAEKRYLLEYKTGLEVKDKELTEIKATLQAKERELDEIRAENDRLKKPFWKRLFKR